MRYRLVDATGTEATVGESYTDFRGEPHEREFSARLIIQPWEVSNVHFMEASA